MQQAVAQLAMAPISAWRSCFQEFRDIARNSGLKGNAMHTLSLAESFCDEKRFWESDWWSVIGDQLEAAASAEASAYARFGVTSRRDLPSSPCCGIGFLGDSRRSSKPEVRRKESQPPLRAKVGATLVACRSQNQL